MYRDYTSNIHGNTETETHIFMFRRHRLNKNQFQSDLTELALRLLACAGHLDLGHLKEILDFSLIQSGHVIHIRL